MSLLALSDASITHLIANVNTNLLKYNKRISKCTQTFPRSLWQAKRCPVLYLFAECGIIFTILVRKEPIEKSVLCFCTAGFFRQREGE